jgi:hypothetical protein
MKKITVFIIAVLMVVTLLPLTALAAGAYSVTYDANGADSGTAPADYTTYNPGDPVTVSANTGLLAKTGSAFTGSALIGSGFTDSAFTGSGLTGSDFLGFGFAGSACVCLMTGISLTSTFSHALVGTGAFAG